MKYQINCVVSLSSRHAVLFTKLRKYMVHILTPIDRYQSHYYAKTIEFPSTIAVMLSYLIR